METEQAHSPEGTSFGSSGDSRWQRPPGSEASGATGRFAPVTWLNLVCLDAPLVSVVWLCLFARTFQGSVELANCAALFLTAWLIYLADRLADSCSLPQDGPCSLRHEFCFSHRRVWAGGLVGVAAADAYLIWWSIGGQTLLAGGLIGALAVIHLVVNYLLGGAWPPLPLKELTIGSLFVAGTLVALLPGFPALDGSLLVSGIAFVGLCTLNCISIAFWERDLDERQRKVSFATRYPGLERHLGTGLIVLTLGSGLAAMACGQAAPLLGSVSASAFLLGLLDSFREKISRDQRTALADLVLFTPLIPLVFMKT